MKLAALAALLAVLAPGAWAIKVERLDTRAHPSLRGLAAVPGASLEVVAGQAMVKFAGGTAPALREAALAGIGARVLREFDSIGWTLVALPEGMRVADGMGLLRGLPGIAAVEPNNVIRPNLVPNDPLVSAQWALSQINAFAGWEYEVGTSCRTTIAVIDAGVDNGNGELTDKMFGLDHRFCDPDAPASDCVTDPFNPPVACYHGTSVAGVAAAAGNNGVQIAGVAWGAQTQILSLRVFRDSDCDLDCCSETHDCTPWGNTCGTDNAGVIQALDYLTKLQNTAEYGKIVANISLGEPGAACPVAVAAQLAVNVTSGIPVLISAGNDGGAVNQPANCAAAAAVIAAGGGVIPVGATDSHSNVASFSCYGPELASYGVVAPGVSVLTTGLSNETRNAIGTSFSAPHAAGLAALILAAKPACPGATQCAAYAQNMLRGGADSLGLAGLGVAAGAMPLGSMSGAGRINAFRSLRLAVKGTLADFDGDKEPIAFPNPFRPSRAGLVSFTIPTALSDQNAKIKVYTASGELVRELVGLAWDGNNRGGNPVATGTYIFVVSTDKGTARGRVVVIR